jgi:hypothetical protein
VVNIDKEVVRLSREIDRLMCGMALKIPYKNLPLVKLEGLSDNVKLIIERRMKGLPGLTKRTTLSTRR